MYYRYRMLVYTVNWKFANKKPPPSGASCAVYWPFSKVSSTVTIGPSLVTVKNFFRKKCAMGRVYASHVDSTQSCHFSLDRNQSMFEDRRVFTAGFPSCFPPIGPMHMTRTILLPHGTMKRYRCHALPVASVNPADAERS